MISFGQRIIASQSLTGECEKTFYGVLYHKAEKLGLNSRCWKCGRPCAYYCPPRLSVAECVRQVKGASAYAINRIVGSNGQFQWQSGYGALTIDERAIEAMKSYVLKQKQHHRDKTLMHCAAQKRGAAIFAEAFRCGRSCIGSYVLSVLKREKGEIRRPQSWNRKWHAETSRETLSCDECTSSTLLA